MSVVDRLLGASFLQPVFERLHGLALAGMNYDRSWDVSSSGEAVALRYLRLRTLPADSVIVDAGASVGDYTEAVLRTFGPACRVHAFEPSTCAHAELSKRFVNDARVEVHRCALGADEHSSALLHQDSPGSATASLYAPRGASGETSIEAVSIRTLDAFCAERNINKVDLLKIDTEGYEFQVLRGANALLQRTAITAVQFELSAKTIDAKVFFRDFWETLHPHYDLYRVVRDGLRPIPEYSSRQEIFMTINFLGLLRNHDPSANH